MVGSVIDRRLVPPDAEILHPDGWTAIRDFAETPWLDEWARQAIQAVKAPQRLRALDLAENILAYAGDHEEREAVALAKLVLGHCCLCDNNNQWAVVLFEAALRKPSAVEATARNNLGVAWARLGNPVAARREFETALSVDPAMIVAQFNLHELAGRMVVERAANLPGRGSWNELLSRTAADLARRPVHEIRSYIDGAGVFPGIEFLHVLEFSESFPRLSARMPANPTAESAARHLIGEARMAFSAGQYSQAVLLGGKASEKCALVKSEADELIAAAKAKLEAAASLEQAQLYAAQLRYDESGDELRTTTGRRQNAAIRDDLAHGKLESAQDGLWAALSTDPSPVAVARRKVDIVVAELLGQARQFLQKKQSSDATRCLRLALRHAPRNREALEMLLSLEILIEPSLPGTEIQQAAVLGQAAIAAFLENDSARCASFCAAFSKSLKTSSLVSHLQKAPNGLEPSPNVEGHRD